MDALFGLAVVAGDVAAREAAVQHAGVALRLAFAGHRVDGLRDVLRAGDPFARTQVEVGQLALEETRQHRTDRMGIPQQRDAMLGAQACQLSGQFVTVGLPDLRAPRGDLRLVRYVLRIAIDRCVVEGVERDRGR